MHIIMNGRERFRHMGVHIGSIIFVFSLGFLTFWISSLRIGPHSARVRQAGADAAMERIVTVCDLPKHRSTIVRCLSNEITKAIPVWGLEPLVIATTKRRATQPKTDLAVSRCHDVTHQLGKNAVLLGVGMKEILTACTDLCQSGCFHGASVGWVAKGESLGKNFTSICLTPGITGEKKYSCIHGMGHAVTPMGLYDVKRSLEYCNIYDFDDRPECGAGVFMEVYDGTEYSNGVLRALPENRPDWCAQFEAPYDEVCYSESGFFEYTRTQNLAASIAICRKEPQAYQFDCLTFIGRGLYFVYPLTQTQKVNIENYCRQVLPEQYDDCLYEVQTDFIQ